MITRFIGGYSEYCKNIDTSVNFSLLHNEDFNCSTVENARWISYQVITPTIITIGVLGNILNLIVLPSCSLKQGTKIYLTGLAITDLSVLICGIPLAVHLSDMHSRAYAAAIFHAHFEIVLLNISIASSIFIVTCLTLDRYISISYPTTILRMHTKKSAYITLFGCYFLAIVISLPLALLKRVCIVEKTENLLQWDSEENTSVTETVYWTMYLWFSEPVMRMGPLIILGILNLLIIKTFRAITKKRKKFKPKMDSRITQKKYYEDRHIIILLQGIVVIFFITMMPSAVLSLIYSEVHQSDIKFQVFRAVANNLEMVNSAFNFGIYFLCSQEFQIALKNVFNKFCTATVKGTIVTTDNGIVNNSIIIINDAQ